MNIQQIYKQYNTPDLLQLHMLRVAGVAQTICNHRIGTDIHTQDIITAALLHDMGNIVRSGFGDKLLNHITDAEKQHIKHIREDMRKRFGTNDHQANIAIAKDIGVNRHIISLIDGISRGKAKDRQRDYDQIIVHYADYRVTPHHVVSIKDRFIERKERNAQHTHVIQGTRKQELQKAQQEEKQIDEYTTITLGYINDDSITPLIDSLRDFEINIQHN